MTQKPYIIFFFSFFPIFWPLSCAQIDFRVFWKIRKNGKKWPKKGFMLYTPTIPLLAKNGHFLTFSVFQKNRSDPTPVPKSESSKKVKNGQKPEISKNDVFGQKSLNFWGGHFWRFFSIFSNFSKIFDFFSIFLDFCNFCYFFDFCKKSWIFFYKNLYYLWSKNNKFL